MLSKPPAPKSRFRRDKFVTWWFGQQARYSSRDLCWRATLKRSTLLAFTVLLLTAAHGYRYYNEPQLTISSIAPQTEFAPENRDIVDPVATKAREDALRADAIQALQVDENLNAEMQASLDRLWSNIGRVAPLFPDIPFVPTDILSTETQQHLLALSAEHWQQVRDAAISPELRSNISSEDDLQAIEELERRWQRVTTDAPNTYLDLLDTLGQNRQQFLQSAERLRQLDLPPSLLTWTAIDRARVEREMRATLRRLQAIGIAPGLPTEMRQQGIDAHLDSLPPHLRLEATEWMLDIVRVNLTVDRTQTQAQLAAKIAAMAPVVESVKAGERIVSAGETITPKTFAILDAYQLTQRRINVWGLLRLAGILTVAALGFVTFEPRVRTHLRDRDRLLLALMIATVAPIASTLGVQFTSLPAVGLLASSYYGAGVGLLVVGATTLLLPLATAVSGLTLVPVVAGSVVACTVAARLRSREELALLGGGAALTQMVVYAGLSLLTLGGIDAGAMALGGAVGLLWSIVALGASPNLEPVFDIVTPIRLAELANPNRPLLRRLATEAPGTYQHTLFVAALAERAAQKLNLNAELVRTGTLYHDIGKMLQAEYFIENQMGGPNPHVALDDPYRSAEIIKDHVTDGLKMARQYRLPTAIRAFIPEHQGTIRIAYFYHQAQLRHPEQLPEESAFRYDGPIPQTRETGVVMLADACEAALRSLFNQDGEGQCVSEVDARRTISRIFHSRWQDKQLIDSGLTRDDLEIVADVFVQVWRQYNHERIRYPSPLLSSPSS